MKISLTSDRLSYRLLIRGKYTMLHGLSGTGKTRLLKFARQYNRGAPITYNGPGTMYSTFDMRADQYTKLIQTCIGDVFLFDEDCDGLYDEEFLDLIKASPNYFLIVSREQYIALPYGVESICVLEGGPTHYHMEPMYPRYRWPAMPTMTYKDSALLCEDKGNGFICAERLLGKIGYKVYHADGKDNLPPLAQKLATSTSVFIAADICGLGYTTHAIFSLLANVSRVYLSSSRSFEYCALQSRIVEDFMPYDYLDTSMLSHASEERYYTDLLHDLLSRTYGISYRKTNLNFCALICTGRVLLNKQMIRACFYMQDGTWLYPDIPRVVSESLSEVITGDTGGSLPAIEDNTMKMTTSPNVIETTIAQREAVDEVKKCKSAVQCVQLNFSNLPIYEQLRPLTHKHKSIQLVVEAKITDQFLVKDVLSPLVNEIPELIPILETLE